MIRYLLSMASLCLLDLALSGVYVVISGHYEAIGTVLVLNLALLGGVNVLVASRIYAPVRRGAADGASPEEREAATRLLRDLPLRSALWAALLSAVYNVAVFASGTFTPQTEIIAAVPVSTRVLALAWFVLIYAVYYGLYIYFLVGDLTESLRVELYSSRALEITPRSGGFNRKLTFILVVLALLPNVHLILDLTLFTSIRAAQGISIAQTVFLDLGATLVVFCVALVFITRTLTRPVNALSEALEQTATGDLSARVPIMSDDEMGVLSASFNRMLDGLRERAFIRETFGRYVPESVVAAIVAGKAPVEPQLATATILFADVANFTRTCERMEPGAVVDMLNAYYAAVVEVIERYGGVVNQFQGDGILVTFNVPVADSDHAANAVRAALDVLDVVARNRFAGIALETRIGINTGKVVAGNVGSPGRYNYTVHGDAVNVAARLEAMNKELGTHLLVSHDTMRLLGDTHGLIPLGEFDVAGKQDRVAVYGVAVSDAGGEP